MFCASCGADIDFPTVLVKGRIVMLAGVQQTPELAEALKKLENQSHPLCSKCAEPILGGTKVSVSCVLSKDGAKFEQSDGEQNPPILR
jgi:hypothetical protein